MSRQDPLGLAKLFVKTVVRMFYETEHIVVVDALVFHSAYV
jgi:transcription initiation factor TFIIE subunit alpha